MLLEFGPVSVADVESEVDVVDEVDEVEVDVEFPLAFAEGVLVPAPLVVVEELELVEVLLLVDDPDAELVELGGGAV